MFSTHYIFIQTCHSHVRECVYATKFNNVFQSESDRILPHKRIRVRAIRRVLGEAVLQLPPAHHPATDADWVNALKEPAHATQTRALLKSVIKHLKSMGISETDVMNFDETKITQFRKYNVRSVFDRRPREQAGGMRVGEGIGVAGEAAGQQQQQQRPRPNPLTKYEKLVYAVVGVVAVLGFILYFTSLAGGFMQTFRENDTYHQGTDTTTPTTTSTGTGGTDTQTGGGVDGMEDYYYPPHNDYFHYAKGTAWEGGEGGGGGRRRDGSSGGSMAATDAADNRWLLHILLWIGLIVLASSIHAQAGKVVFFLFLGYNLVDLFLGSLIYLSHAMLQFLTASCASTLRVLQTPTGLVVVAVVTVILAHLGHTALKARAQHRANADVANADAAALRFRRAYNARGD
mmetsp:Transcript_18460/g.30923  ORF Transcript_18460/g.30923 Transcript_18460/m.30923 type:complete len:402 (+) Transcript_18460:51-1256(+)